jgi:hypothetical protein
MVFFVKVHFFNFFFNTYFPSIFYYFSPGSQALTRSVFFGGSIERLQVVVVVQKVRVTLTRMTPADPFAATPPPQRAPAAS